MSITKGTFLAGSAMNMRRVRVFKPVHCPSVSTFSKGERAARTGGKLFHGRPPGVVTAKVSEAMRCGMREASSVAGVNYEKGTMYGLPTLRNHPTQTDPNDMQLPRSRPSKRVK